MTDIGKEALKQKILPQKTTMLIEAEANVYEKIEIDVEVYEIDKQERMKV